MTTLPQQKTGYLKGCRGLILTPLNEDGSLPSTPVKHAIKTSQSVSVELETVDGESGELRGGDRVLARFEEHDVVVGANLTFTDARFDAQAAQIIGGGELITVTEGTDQRVTGWSAPTIEQQSTRTPFKAELYVTNFNKSGGVDGYLRYTFPYCIGYAPGIEHQDQEWGTPEFEIRARENPSTGASYVQKEFVDTLPADLQ
jgi:hypothetical protein